MISVVWHRPTQYGIADILRKYLLDRLMNTCLYVVISTDKRFVVPNRVIRIGERGYAARPRVAALRAQFDDRPLVLTTPGSVNWITGGLSDPIDLTAASDPMWAVDSKNGRALITSEIEAPRLQRDFDLESLGWDVITVPWFDAGAPLRAAASFSGVAPEGLLSDSDGFGTNVTSAIIRARLVLSDPEREDLRELGALAARALEVGIESWRPGDSTDFEIASVISGETGAIRRQGRVPHRGRWRSTPERCAIPSRLATSFDDALMAVVVARRGGLHVAATRSAASRR